MTTKRKTPSNSDGDLTLPINVTAQLIPIVKYISENIETISSLKGFNKVLKDKGFDLPPEIVDAVKAAYDDDEDDRQFAFHSSLPSELLESIYDDPKEESATLDFADDDDDDDHGGLGFKPDSASVFARYLMDDLGLEVFKDQHDIAYLRWKDQVHSLDQKKGRLVIMSLALVNKAPVSSTFITNVCAVLSAVAITESEEPEFVYLRFAPYQTGSLIDLGNKDQEVILVNKDGWDIIPRPDDVAIIRSDSTGEMFRPQKCEDPEIFRKYLNIKDDVDYRLMLSCLVAYMHPEGNYPLLTLMGQQGTAKSTAAKMIKSLIDPSHPSIRSPAKTEWNLVIGALNSAILAWDNVSSLSDDISDALCRLATGGGIGMRTLYTTQDETLMDLTRPVIMTSIGNVTERADLQDRVISIFLQPISDEQRRDEARLYEAFNADAPKIVGFLLHALSMLMKNLDSVELTSMPRMADFARKIVAIAPAIGWTEDEALAAYKLNTNRADQLLLENSLISAPLIKLMEKNSFDWFGSMTELMSDLANCANQDSRIVSHPRWPKAANAMRSELNYCLPALRRIWGVEVEDMKRTATSRGIRIFVPNEENQRQYSQSDDDDDGHDAQIVERSSQTNLGGNF
jgi:hypothetical protein